MSVVADGNLAAEKARLIEEIAKRRAEVAMKRELCAALFDRAEDGIVIAKSDHTFRVNPASEAMTKVPVDEFGVPIENWQATWKFFRLEDGKPVNPEELPSFRVLREAGESKVVEELEIHSPYLPEPVYIASIAQRLPGGGSIAVTRNITDRVRQERQLANRNTRLSEQDAEHRLLIDRLRVALGELATPVLQVGEGVLVLPIIGVLDTERSVQISERLLAEVVRTRASRVIIDVTGVEVMDTSTADRFAKLARGVELLGAKCFLSGVQPSVAQTLVALDVKLDAMSPHRNLAHALASSAEANRSRVRKRM